MQTKEQIYDEKVSPLMKQVITLCKENGIAMLAHFVVPSEDTGCQAVQTYLPDETGKVPPTLLDAINCLRSRQPAPLMLKTTDADGGLTMTAVLG